MPTASPEFDRTGLRIRTLTATLRKMQQAERPQSTRSEVPSFLRHMATLLTCGSSADRQAKPVVAVTGAIEATGVKTLVVVQNALSGRGPQPFSLEGRYITKKDDSFDAIISGLGSARLEEHISDLLGLLSCCDPTDVVKIEDFSAFITMRSIQELYSRLTSDKRNWYLRVHEVLKVWVPNEGDSSLKALWVKKPRWAGHFPDDFAEIEKRGTGKSEEWKFSPTTAPRWAQALAALLSGLESRILQYRDSRDADKLNPLQPQTNRSKQDVQNTLREINSISFSLCFSTAPDVTDKHNEIPGGVNSSTEESSKAPDVTDERDDEDSDLAREAEETEGGCVYRYLQAIVAWQAALEALLQPRYRNVLSNISVGLVEVVGSEFELMQADEFVTEYFARPSVPVFSGTKAEVREILKADIPARFNDTIHAEATLMGLLTYFSHCQGNASNYAGDIINIDVLKESIEPALVKPAIGLSKKCCWCCYRLAAILQEHYGDESPISLPGTHGILYAWCPPRVGIAVEVLKKLESELWAKLDQAIRDKLLRRAATHSRQSSGSSSVPDEPFERMPAFPVLSLGSGNGPRS